MIRRQGAGLTAKRTTTAHAAELVELERYERDPAAWMRKRLLDYLNDITKNHGQDTARRQAMRYVREGRLEAADLDDHLRER